MPIKTRTVSLLLLLLSLTLHCTYCRRLVCFFSCRYARAPGLVYIVDVLFVSFLADTHAKVRRSLLDLDPAAVPDFPVCDGVPDRKGRGRIVFREYDGSTILVLPESFLSSLSIDIFSRSHNA